MRWPTMRRTFAIVVALVAVLAAQPVHAFFHFARIAEINAQGGGSAAVQYVEIEMEAAVADLHHELDPRRLRLRR